MRLIKQTEKIKAYETQLEGKRVFLKVAQHPRADLKQEFEFLQQFQKTYTPTPIKLDGKKAYYEFIDGPIFTSMNDKIVQEVISISKDLFDVDAENFGLPYKAASKEYFYKRSLDYFEYVQKQHVATVDAKMVEVAQPYLKKLADIDDFAYIESKKLIHNDPSRDNWMITQDGIKLIDWERVHTGDFSIYVARLIHQLSFSDKLEPSLSDDQTHNIISELSNLDDKLPTKLKNILPFLYFEGMCWYIYKYSFMQTLEPKDYPDTREPQLSMDRFYRSKELLDKHLS